MLVVTTLPASAAVVAETDGFPGNLDAGYSPDAGDFYGDLSFSFTTDANDYVFNSVTLMLGTGDNGGTSGQFFSVTLGADNSGVPGAAMEVLAGSADPTGSDAPYTYSGSSTLTANTTYWITLSNSNNNALYDFWAATTTQESAGSVWSIGDDIYSSLLGFQSANGPFVSQFDATAVPEPGSATLILLGVMGLGYAFRNGQARPENAA